MKAHIGVDTAHGLVHTLEVTTGKVSDYSMADTLLHGDEATAHGDREYADKTREPDRPREEDDVGPRWFVPFKRKKDCDTTPEQKRLNRILSGLRSAVEHPFRVLKRQFGHTKVRYRGLFKNEPVQPVCLGEPVSNTAHARPCRLSARGGVCPVHGKTALEAGEKRKIEANCESQAAKTMLGQIAGSAPTRSGVQNPAVQRFPSGLDKTQTLGRKLAPRHCGYCVHRLGMVSLMPQLDTDRLLRRIYHARNLRCLLPSYRTNKES
jgi:hypothetical protein